LNLMGHSRIARARGLAQAISECRDDARLDGIREGAAEIVGLLDLPITDDRGAVEALKLARYWVNPDDERGKHDLKLIDAAIAGGQS
jgi:hypothetical protein